MRALRALAALTIAAGTTLAVAAPALAADDCRTSTATLTDRPDSGTHGDWALDQLTRTTTVCETSAGAYHATVTDTGTFSTIAGNSPGAGVPLAIGISGTVAGGFTTDITAAAGFVDYNGVHDGATYTGATHPTGGWLGELFDGGIQGEAVGDDWSWTYTTCSETWTNANAGNSGDITTAPVCKTTAAPTTAAPTTAAPTTQAATTTTAPATTAAAVPTSTTPSGEAAPELPVTGGSLTWLIVVAAALVAGGAGVLLLARQRRSTT